MVLFHFSTRRYRFDELGVELFSDSDRLSYTSLSRSSSLIQFESLERQLQSDSQISGSSPSIYSYEGVASSIGPAVHNSQEIIENSAPIAINLPTIKITNPPPSAIQFTNSDSEPFSSSSTSGSFSSDDCEIHREKSVTTVDEAVNDSSLSSNASSEGKTTGSISTNTSAAVIISSENRKKFLNSFRAKNSVDSLSEDSGYCDRDTRSLPAGALSLDSSLPTGNDLEDEEGNVIEEKSLLSRESNPMRQFLLTPRIRSHSDDDDICYHSMENLNRRFKTRKIDLLSVMNIESMATHKTPNPKPPTAKLLKIESPNVHIPTEHKPRVKNKNEENSHQPQSEKLISISLPELSASGDISRRSRSKLKRNYRESFDELNDHFSSVSSVPDNINLSFERGGDASDHTPSWTEPSDSIASKNFNLYDLNYGQTPSTAAVHKQKVVDISASCANLTLLNYSDEDDFCYDSHKLMSISRSKSQTMSGKLPVNAFSSDDDDDDAFIASYRSKELSSLLEEISAHFDKNLSILNDREASYEPQVSVRDSLKLRKVKGDDKVEIKSVQQSMKTPPPKPPPRRSQIKTSPNHSVPKTATFDRDPTNLVTTYAQSMEKCNFNVDEPINVYSSRQNLYLTPDEADGGMKDDLPQSTPIKKRNFVSSTPNLNFFDLNMKHVNHYSSTDNTAVGHDLLSPSFTNDDDIRCTSMKEIPTDSRAGSTGILASHSTAGSKGGLSVSFCPIVSEISWQENVDDDDFSDDVEMDPSGEQYSSARSDSLVNYYNNNDDDDEEEDFDDFIAVGSSSTDIASCGVVAVDREVSPKHSQVTDENIAISKRETSTHSNNETSERENKAEPTFDSTVKLVSQKMLVETQTPSEKFIATEASAGSMDKKVNSQTLTTVPHKVASEPSLVPSKSAKNKKSIFSRLSSGFRFSFRGKKNKKLTDGVVHYPAEANNNSGNKRVDKSQTNVAKTVDGDGVFIPLKDPNDNNVKNHQHAHVVTGDQLANVSEKLQTHERQQQQQQLTVDRQSRAMQHRESLTKSGGNQVMGKPPLPKQPPRIVGTTTKRPSTHAPRASSTPREIESDGGEFFNQSMIGDGLKQYYSGGSRTMGTLGSEHKIGLIETNLDTDETIINGKTQSLMELGIGQNGGNRIMGRMAGMGGVQVMQNVNSVTGGANTETGRPHKSMEFLLDKENHQRVLVSR